jgi:hypothetical protein
MKDRKIGNQLSRSLMGSPATRGQVERQRVKERAVAVSVLVG